MKILFVIPHYFGTGPQGYGSTNDSQRAKRLEALRAVIVALHQHSGAQQCMLTDPAQAPRQANQAISNDIDIVLCTTGNNHLLDELDLAKGRYERFVVDIPNPLYLGYSAYAVFKQAYGHYDWYCYLEDDIVIYDPLFFSKLQSFYLSAANNSSLLQPNRYEVSPDSCSKMYIDSHMAPGFDVFRLPNHRQRIDINFLGTPLRMVPAENPHSGCFFLTEEHLGALLEKPWYGNDAGCFAGPLESAATFPITTVFHVFKPSQECAGFLEVHHFHRQCAI